MPNRILRDWTDSEPVSSLSAHAERLFTRLLMKMDDFGCFHANPRLVRANLFPLLIDQIREADVSRWIAECEKAGLVRSYEVASKRYLVVPKHGQRLRKARHRFPVAPSSCGELPQVAASCGELPPESETDIESESESDIESPLPPSADKPPKIAATTIPPPAEAVAAYMATRGLPATEAEKFVDFYESKGWVVGKCRMKNWQSSCRNWEKGYREKHPAAAKPSGDDFEWNDTHTDAELREMLGGDDAE